MTTNFPTAPGAYGLNGPSAPLTVEKSPHASHTEILTPPCRYCKTCNPVQSALTKPTIAIQSSVICTLQTSRRLFLLAKIALCSASSTSTSTRTEISSSVSSVASNSSDASLLATTNSLSDSLPLSLWPPPSFGWPDSQQTLTRCNGSLQRHQPGYHITANAQSGATNHLGELFIAIRRPGFAGNCRGFRKGSVANRNCRFAFFMRLHWGALVGLTVDCCHHG